MQIVKPVTAGPEPFSLRDRPSFIEAQFPVGRISAESYKERKAGAGQTLTALGSYWKGRKPLVLVRATVLGCLLPATEDPVADLRVFLLLMGMDDTSFARRIKSVKPSDVATDFPRYLELIDPPDNGVDRPRWRHGLDRDERDELIAEWLATIPYDQRLKLCYRPDEVDDILISPSDWGIVNAHLGTTASSLSQLVEQLGIMRFGRRPKLADTFAGGGSIPFEAAHMGCDVQASDLNPVACMLTWGAFNIIGARPEDQPALLAEQKRLSKAAETEIDKLAIERDRHGNRAKAFFYCMETRCPKTGWLVPMASSWVISKQRNVVAQLVPNHASQTYDIVIKSGVDAAAMAAAELGTARKGRLVHPMNPERDGVAISVIRGDHRTDGENKNRLRQWAPNDFVARPDDIWRERLYCIQWISKETFGKGRQETYFASVTEEDALRERKVETIVRENLAEWQLSGLVPDMAIMPGDKTSEPIRTRGWTHWHQLFSPRDLLFFSILKPSSSSMAALIFAKLADRTTKLCGWATTKNLEAPTNVFANQALTPMMDYCIYSSSELLRLSDDLLRRFVPMRGTGAVISASADKIQGDNDLYVTDPPYADAVNYHELTEFFIAWLNKNAPKPFDEWRWDSQRSQAIQGTDEKFRSDMVAAYRAMAEHMPENGMQVVMFTHQDAGVWADLASIMWAAGLRVTGAWNVVTEAESALREGNYVQGTILLVLRKRVANSNIKRMDIEGEIENEVELQLGSLNALDQDWTSERLYSDGDLQLAAYAAALRVITTYSTIDRKEVGADVYRKLAKGEKTIIRELIEYAASVANNKLVPDGFPANMWRDLDSGSRFYVRMLDMEASGSTRFADYQDFARSFSFAEYDQLMDSTKANAASLAGAGVLKGRMLGANGFGSTHLRRVLFAIFKTMQKDDPREGLAFLKTDLGQDYWPTRMKLVELARYVSLKTSKTRPEESSAADLIAQRLEVDRL
jgi:putative DNA methylase